MDGKTQCEWRHHAALRLFAATGDLLRLKRAAAAAVAAADTSVFIGNASAVNSRRNQKRKGIKRWPAGRLKVRAQGALLWKMLLCIVLSKACHILCHSVG